MHTSEDDVDFQPDHRPDPARRAALVLIGVGAIGLVGAASVVGYTLLSSGDPQPSRSAGEPVTTASVNMAPPSSAPVKAAPARSEKTLTTTDPIFQFGAYSSKAAAESAWRDLARRLPEARSLTPVVERRDAVHRLRASGPAAAALCDRWRAAGGQCFAAG